MKTIDHLLRDTHLLTIRILSKEDKDIWPHQDSFSRYLNALKDLRLMDREYHLVCFNKSDQALVASVAIKGVVRDNLQSSYIELAKNKKDLGNLIFLEILAALLDIAFVELQLNRVEILVLNTELQLKQVVLQASMRPEGIRKYAVQKEGEFLDANVYAITKKEYEQNNVHKLMQAGANLR